MGETCEQIAHTLNREFSLRTTRNSVIGKSRRLGCAPHKYYRIYRAESYVSYRSRPKKEKPVKVAKKQKLPNFYLVEAASDLDIPLEQRKQFLDLGPHDCRWPVGEVASENFFFCGAPAEADYPYCAGHCRRAYDTAYRVRREGNAASNAS